MREPRFDMLCVKGLWLCGVRDERNGR